MIRSVLAAAALSAAVTAAPSFGQVPSTKQKPFALKEKITIHASAQGGLSGRIKAKRSFCSAGRTVMVMRRDEHGATLLRDVKTDASGSWATTLAEPRGGGHANVFARIKKLHVVHAGKRFTCWNARSRVVAVKWTVASASQTAKELKQWKVTSSPEQFTGTGAGVAPVPGARFGISVTGSKRHRSLLAVTFSAMSQCSGGPAGSPCPIRIRIDGASADPVPDTGAYVFDSSESQLAAHSLTVTKKVKPGRHTVQVGWAGSDLGTTLTLRNWTLLADTLPG